METFLSFLDELATAEPSLRSVLAAVLADWEGNPPPTTAAAQLARAALARELSGEPIDWERLMAVVERGMNSTDPLVDAAASTGFVEGILFRSERSDASDAWKWLNSAGPETRKFVDALG